MADVKEIIAQLTENKELMEKVAKADPKQAVDLLKKANINVDEADIKKVQDVLGDGKVDAKDIMNLAGGVFRKKEN